MFGEEQLACRYLPSCAVHIIPQTLFVWDGGIVLHGIRSAMYRGQIKAFQGEAMFLCVTILSILPAYTYAGKIDRIGTHKNICAWIGIGCVALCIGCVEGIVGWHNRGRIFGLCHVLWYALAKQTEYHVDEDPCNVKVQKLKSTFALCYFLMWTSIAKQILIQRSGTRS